MPFYYWRAVDEEGIEHNGSLYAASLDELQELIRKKQLGLIQAKQQRVRVLSRTQKDVFFAHLAALLSAHIPLYEALCTMKATQPSAELTCLLDALARKISQGASLTNVLEEHAMLDPLSRALIGVGETTGTLGPLLQQIVEYRTELALSRARIKQAVRMPLITLSFFFAVLLGMLFFAVPQFVGFFEMYPISVPLITSWLIAVSSVLTGRALLGGALSTLLLAFVVRGIILPTKKGQMMKDYIIDRTPVVGALRGAFIRARTLKVLGILVAQQVPLSKALEACEALTFHQRSREALAAVKKSVDQGTALSKAWHESFFKDHEIESLLVLGESSGRLSTLMLYASELIEKNLHGRIEMMITFLNPLLLVVIALLIAGLMYGMYMPLISLSSSF